MTSPTYPPTLSSIIASAMYFSPLVQNLSNLSVIQFKLIRDQNNLHAVLAQYAKYTVLHLVFLRYNCLMVN